MLLLLATRLGGYLTYRGSKSADYPPPPKPRRHESRHQGVERGSFLEMGYARR